MIDREKTREIRLVQLDAQQSEFDARTRVESIEEIDVFWVMNGRMNRLMNEWRGTEAEAVGPLGIELVTSR